MLITEENRKHFGTFGGVGESEHIIDDGREFWFVDGEEFEIDTVKSRFYMKQDDHTVSFTISSDLIALSFSAELWDEIIKKTLIRKFNHN